MRNKLLIHLHSHDKLTELRWLLLSDGQTVDRFAILRSGAIVNRYWENWDGGVPFNDY